MIHEIQIFVTKRLTSPFTDKYIPALPSNIINSKKKHIEQVNSTPVIFLREIIDFTGSRKNLMKLNNPKFFFFNFPLTKNMWFIIVLINRQ